MRHEELFGGCIEMLFVYFHSTIASSCLVVLCGCPTQAKIRLQQWSVQEVLAGMELAVKWPGATASRQLLLPCRRARQQKNLIALFPRHFATLRLDPRPLLPSAVTKATVVSQSLQLTCMNVSKYQVNFCNFVNV